MSQRPEFFPARELFDRLVAEQKERPSQTSEANLESVKQACAVSNSVSDGVTTLDACVSNFKT